jgi:hypothetical protein
MILRTVQVSKIHPVENSLLTQDKVRGSLLVIPRTYSVRINVYEVASVILEAFGTLLILSGLEWGVGVGRCALSCLPLI